MQKEIKVPNIGDFKDVEVIEVLVSEGDEIKKDDPLITIESDKSSVEIPSTEVGIIKKLNIKVGDKVSEGDKILELDINEEKNDNKYNLYKKKIENSKIQVKKEDEASKEEQKIFNLEKEQDNDLVLASPKARKFARELGVDVNRIAGSQLKGRVNEADIKKFISSKVISVETPKIDPEKVVQEKKKIKLEFEHSDFGIVDAIK